MPFLIVLSPQYELNKSLLIGSSETDTHLPAPTLPLLPVSLIWRTLVGSPGAASETRLPCSLLSSPPRTLDPGCLQISWTHGHIKEDLQSYLTHGPEPASPGFPGSRAKNCLLEVSGGDVTPTRTLCTLAGARVGLCQPSRVMNPDF